MGARIAPGSRYDGPVIRSMIATDAPEIAAFYVDIRRDTVPLIHEVDEVVLWMIDRLLPRGSSFVWEEDGKLLAWLDTHEGWIDQLYCRRGATGRGLGTRLLEFAKARSHEGLELYTFLVNTGARRFYAREGFAEVGWGDGSGNEEGEPDVRMVWTPKA